MDCFGLSQGYSAHLASMDRSGSSKVSSVQDVWDVYRRVFVLADLVLALRGIQFHQKLKQFFGGGQVHMQIQFLAPVDFFFTVERLQFLTRAELLFF